MYSPSLTYDHLASLNIVLIFVLALLWKIMPIDRKRKTKYGYMFWNRFICICISIIELAK
jgi:hypothetical protein